MRVLLYAKMLEETEETIVFFVTFLSLVAFQLKGGAGILPPLPSRYAYFLRKSFCPRRRQNQ